MKLDDAEIKYLQAKEAYYEGNPIMDDIQFDVLEEILKERNSPAIDMVGFKTKGVLYDHLTPMKSLDKIQFQTDYVPYDEFLKWLDQNSDRNDVVEASPKMDGNAVNLIYKRGKLHKAVTRGDGKEGQDVTDKLRHRVPTEIPLDKTLEIRGEVVIKVSTFNEKYGPGTEMDKKNPRNFVAGMLNRDQIEFSILNDLDFVGFEIKMNATTWMGHPFEHLHQWGFIDIFHESYQISNLRTREGFLGMFNTFEEYRKTSEYLLDGIVLKFGNNMRTPDMEKDHHPKWALAIKFPPMIGRTRLIDVEWNLGTTGVLVPTGILEPVDLDGSTVQRVTLYNYGWPVERELGIGAEIEIVKSGDIIPKIHTIITKGAEFPYPKTWEGHKTYVDDIHLRVENFDDLPEFKALKMHRGFVALGMKGIGRAMADRIFTPGQFETIEDIFGITFTEENLIATGKFVKGRELEIVLNIVNGIKEVEYWKLFNAISIVGNGRTLSKQLANYYSEVDYDFAGLEKAVVDRFLKKGPELSRVLALRKNMEAKGVKIIYPVKVDKSLSSGTFEMTGSPKEHGFPVKADFLKLADSKGFIHEKLTKDSSFLLTDSMSSSSSKMTKAKKLGVEVITYSDFAEKYLK